MGLCNGQTPSAGRHLLSRIRICIWVAVLRKRDRYSGVGTRPTRTELQPYPGRVRQGTRTAWASLVLLVALTVGAASLSIATASSFSLASLSPSAALRYAVSATLDTSFTVSWSSG